MKPKHPVELLVCAIYTQEGTARPTTEGHQRNNPGNIRYAGQVGAHCPRCNATDGFVPRVCEVGGIALDFHDVAGFLTWAMGVAALFRQVWLQVVEGQTVAQIIRQYAPPNENDTQTYIANVVRWTGLASGLRPLDMLPALMLLAARSDPSER